MVAIGRPLLSDAEWPNKVHAGLKDELVDHYQWREPSLSLKNIQSFS